MQNVSNIKVLTELDFLLSILNKENPNLYKHNLEVFKIAKVILHNFDYLNNPIDPSSFRLLRNLGINNISLLYSFHDIGKSYIDKDILDANRKLSKEEFAIVKTHVKIGEEIFNSILKNRDNLSPLQLDIYKASLLIIGNHHENIDGSGYPYNKKGKQIPFLGQVARVADVISALMSKRIYKNPWTSNETINYLNKNKNSLFNPQIVDVALENWSQIANIFNPNSFILNNAFQKVI